MAVVPDMVGLIVADLRRSVEFYRILGLEIPEAPEEDYFQIITPNGYRISWNTEALARQIDPDWTPPTGQRIGLAFLFESPAEVDAAYQRLLEAGYPGYKAPWDAFWGQRYAQVKDPDGMTVDLFAPLSVAEGAKEEA